MFYTIYKTTNAVNGRVYIGAHATPDINDGYLGSGKYLKRAIKKWGVENFSKEILFSFTNERDMFQKERELVTEDFISSNGTYNIKLGGSGGNPGPIGAFSGRKHSEETKKRIRDAAFRQVTTKEKRVKLSKNNWAKRDPIAHKKHISEVNLNRIHSEDHRKKVAAANLGRILVNNGLYAKRIKKEDLEQFEQNGWKRGGMPRKRK